MSFLFNIRIIKIFFLSLLFIASLCIVSCGELDFLYDSDEDESTSVDTWGQIMDEPADVFVAADLSDAVKNGIVTGLAKAAEVWGNYGPLEYWVLGTEVDAANDLSELYCERRSQRGDLYKSNCLVHNQQSDHGFESYRKVGYDAITSGQASSSMGRNGARDWGIHRFTSSYPFGFDSVLGATPKGEMITVYHEYFHAVQHAFVFSLDFDERDELMGPTWFVEGAAVYMAELFVRKMLASGDLVMTDNNDLDTFKVSFEFKMDSGKQSIDNDCPGTSFKDITYELGCSYAAYDLGAWAIAYLSDLVADENALLNRFYPKLNELGWEGAFQASFGISSSQFYADFDGFLSKDIEEQTLILSDL